MAMRRMLGQIPEGAEQELGAEWVERRKALDQKILDLVGEDPGFKAKLFKDPQSALRGAGLLDEHEALREIARGEVAGHSMGDPSNTCAEGYTEAYAGAGGAGGGFGGQPGQPGQVYMCCEWSS